jgi:putative transposase
VFAGQNAGIKQVGDKVWLASFTEYDLGDFDDEKFRIERAENGFAAKLSPLSSV